MVNVESEILTRRPREEVAEYAANPDNAESGGGTRMTLGNTGQPSGFSRLAGLLMPPMIRRATRKDLQKLKSILESGS